MKIFLKTFFEICGKKVSSLLFFGIGFGTLAFVIEYAFAHVIQLFLYGLQLVNKETLTIPQFFLSWSLQEIILCVIGIAFFRSIFQFFQAYLQGAVREWFVYRHRSLLVDYSFECQSVNSGLIVTTFYEVIQGAGSVVAQLQTLIIQLTTTILLICTLFKISWVPTLGGGFLLGLVAIPIFYLDRKIGKIGSKIYAVAAITNKRLLSAIKNLIFIQLSGTQNLEKKLSNNSLLDALHATLHYNQIRGLKFAFPQFFGVVILCMTVFFSKKYEIMASSMILTYFYLFLRSIQSLTEVFRSTSEFIVYWPRWKQLEITWNQIHAPKINNRSSTQTLPPLQQIGIEFNNLDFGYTSGKLIFKNLSLKVTPGDLFLVRGPSGVGKSTLIHLMLGYLSPLQGELYLVDNQGTRFDLYSHKSDFLKKTSYVGPEPFLFEGTIQENLCYGLDQKCSKEEIHEVLKKAECHFALEMGTDHIITEQGTGLSAGQKQRISLARALLRNPQVLILDEATSNLDEETEKKVVSTVEKLKNHTTIIVISHKKAFDLIADEKLILS